MASGEKVLNYRNSVQNTYCLAQESAMIAAIVATLWFAQMAIAAVLTGVLAAMAVAFWIAMAIPFGQGFAMSIRTFGTSMVTMLKTVIQTMDDAEMRSTVTGIVERMRARAEE